MSKILTRDVAANDSVSMAVHRAFTRDNLMTFDQLTIDSAGAFFVGQLERLDPTLNMPLAAYWWSRDIDVRGDITLADELASFTLSTFAAAGGINPNGKSWIGKTANTIQEMSLDIGKTGQPLFPWAQVVSATIPEIVSAQQTGHDILSEKFEGLQLKLNMDLDEQAYIGDSTLGVTGMLNNADVTLTTAAATGSGSSTKWADKTPEQILTDFNTMVEGAWAASGYAVCPNRVLVPPAEFAYLAQTIISISGYPGGVSILKYLEDNSVALRVNGTPLQVLPAKWLTGTNNGGQGPGAGGTDRAVAYTKDKKFLRFPKTDIVPGVMEYRSLAQHMPYWGRIGVVEVRYPETMYYLDGIG